MRSLSLTTSLASLLIVSAFPQERPACKTPNLPTIELAKYTVDVTPAPPRAEARAATKGRPEIKLVNGKPFMRITPEMTGQRIEAPQGTALLIRFSQESGARGFSVTPRGVLEAPRGIVHLPHGTIGLLRAVGPGTATIAVHGVPPRTKAASIIASDLSSGWSGYKISSGAPFLSVSGEWTVPTVYGDAGDHSSTWIGIDGWMDDHLIQAGTEQDYSSGVLGTGLFGGPEYYAWWQNSLDDGEQQFSNPVSPGDHMIAVISLSGDPAPGSPMTWLILLMNVTKNWTASKSVSYSGSLQSAEWIVEAPVSCFLWWCSITDLADYGSLSFDIFDTANSLSPGLTPSQSITMAQGNNVVSIPSDPDGDKDGFTVAFGSTKPLPPGPIIVTTSLPQAFMNFPYQTRVFAEGASAFQWSAANLPPWLTFDKNSGVLSGTPTAPGLNFFSVVARDAAKPNISSAIQPLEVTVQATPPPPDFTLSANPVEIHLANTANGCVGSTTITVNPLFGFTDAVQLSASGQGVTSAVFSPTSTHTTSHLTIHSTLCHASNDEHLVSITGKSGSLTHSIAADLVPQSFTGCNTPQARNTRICNP
ncbi:MAG TPA: G1 family glutamic endopeptidase [Terriglobales bacterium]|nr:G1 family glutamic endopeptidase [Terriglobales bacterium]